MSDSKESGRPVDNDETFKPQKVADEGHGQPGRKGRLDREMKANTARGSEPVQRGTAGPRG